MILASHSSNIIISYILNRGWIDRSAKRLPTYDEITSSFPGDNESRKNGKVLYPPPSDLNGELEDPDLEGNDEELDEDDEFEEILDRFESSYNFRFEEP